MNTNFFRPFGAWVAAALVAAVIAAPAVSQNFPGLFPSGSIYGNSTASSGAASVITPSAWLDRWCSSSQGALPSRTTSWACLAPGTAGLPLVSAGAGANLSYAVLGAAGGGSGQSSYAVGDLLYASGATALSKLADVATGNALISGGVTTAPSWGKIGLATHVSGNLGVANLNSGTNASAASFWRGDGAWRAVATTADIWGAGANAPIDPAGLNSAAALISLTDAATVATDMATGVNFTVTLGGNRTLGAPTNTQAGRSGCYFIVQDGTGSRTLAYNAVWKFAGGTAPTLTTTAAAVDMLCYIVRDSTHIHATLNADMK